jgi:spore maturation protein CgeB
MHILYLGDDHPGSTSAHRALALQRLGHDVIIKNPLHGLPDSLKSPLWNAINFKTGYRMIQPAIKSWARRTVDSMKKPDLIWVDSGELLGEKSMQILKSAGCPIVLYNIDDPTGKRDGHRFDLLIKSLLHYDLVVVVRKETELECLALGAKKVIKVNRSYDEIAHRPFENRDFIPEKFKSDIAFIGTWMRKEKRDEFLLKLINHGVPVSIWGDSWQKSPLYAQLKPYYRGSGLSGRDYIAAIQGAKVCLGLLSAGNRDLHTTRSFEVPYAGGLLCAERTTEHTALYKEDHEATFWSDADECAAICKTLLIEDQKRERIRIAGMNKVRSIQGGNEDLCRLVLKEIEKI